LCGVVVDVDVDVVGGVVNDVATIDTPAKCDDDFDANTRIWQTNWPKCIEPNCRRIEAKSELN